MKRICCSSVILNYWRLACGEFSICRVEDRNDVIEVTRRTRSILDEASEWFPSNYGVSFFVAMRACLNFSLFTEGTKNRTEKETCTVGMVGWYNMSKKRKKKKEKRKVKTHSPVPSRLPLPSSPTFKPITFGNSSSVGPIWTTWCEMFSDGEKTTV